MTKENSEKKHHLLIYFKKTIVKAYIMTGELGGKSQLNSTNLGLERSQELVKNTGSSSENPSPTSSNHGSLKSSITPIPGYPKLSSNHLGYYTYTWC